MGIAILCTASKYLTTRFRVDMTSADNLEGAPATGRRPKGRPYRTVPDARSISTLGVGMVIGAVIGAGVALLLAPQSGHDTRRNIGRRVQRARGESRVWTRLGRELKRAAIAKRKSAELEAKRQEIRARKEAGSPSS